MSSFKMQHKVVIFNLGGKIDDFFKNVIFKIFVYFIHTFTATWCTSWLFFLAFLILHICHNFRLLSQLRFKMQKYLDFYLEFSGEKKKKKMKSKPEKCYQIRTMLSCNAIILHCSYASKPNRTQTIKMYKMWLFFFVVFFLVVVNRDPDLSSWRFITAGLQTTRPITQQKKEKKKKKKIPTHGACALQHGTDAHSDIVTVWRGRRRRRRRRGTTGMFANTQVKRARHA